MLVANSLNDLKFDHNSIVTVGTFDGVHLGHSSIIKKLVDRAKDRKARSVIITFEPHPRVVLGKGNVMLLTTLTDRIEQMESFGVDAVLVLEFTYDFSRQTALEFYEKYLIRGIGVREVIVGYDHMFGRDRISNVNELKQMGKEIGFDVLMVEPVAYDGEIISSTKIRTLLQNGNVEKAMKFLNRPYSIEGTVIAGDRRGESLGFPTANILPESSNKLIPADGVYCVKVSINEQQIFGMLNIGVKPTFGSESKQIIEVNIFNFDGDIYGKKIRVYFLKRLRDEKKFSSKEDLINQLERDRNESMKIITQQ
ncbi:MAG: bifunctional riboflavin kinase/FAD synthetase [Bacteroidota bacterium]|nr:bifunctional riboflavin kinase/FAD synthetase [Bacteroidota bacterium]